MSIATSSSLAAMRIAIDQARLEAMAAARAASRGGAPAPVVQRSNTAAQHAEALGEQIALALAQERQALAQMQATLRSLPSHDPVIGTLLDLSA